MHYTFDSNIRFLRQAQDERLRKKPIVVSLSNHTIINQIYIQGSSMQIQQSATKYILISILLITTHIYPMRPQPAKPQSTVMSRLSSFAQSCASTTCNYCLEKVCYCAQSADNMLNNTYYWLGERHGQRRTTPGCCLTHRCIKESARTAYMNGYKKGMNHSAQQVIDSDKQTCLCCCPCKGALLCCVLTAACLDANCCPRKTQKQASQ